MKSLLGLSLLVLVLASGCASIDKSKAGGKDVIIATRATPVIFTFWGSPVDACVKDLQAAGVKDIVNVSGSPTGGLFILSRLWGLDSCQAVGTK